METINEKLWLKRISIASRIEVEKLASWMIKMGYSTGHGNNMDDLLKELEWQVKERRSNEIPQKASSC